MTGVAAMYISDWTPPETREDVDGDAQGGGIVRPILALIVIVAITVAAMFACNYSSDAMVCTPYAAEVEAC